MDDFMEHVWYPAMPTNILKADTIQDLADVDTNEVAKSITDLKLAINDMAQGYANYYPGLELHLCEDNMVSFANSELNTVVKLVMVALDTGLTSHTYNSDALGLTNTSWFCVIHSIMGAALWGAMCSPHFCALRKHSLNSIKDHLIVAKGLY